MQWLNEPAEFSDAGGRITIRAKPQTDFWRVTHDGGVRDSGHFYYRTVSGNFSATVRFSAGYRDLYDQAGIMLRVDEAAGSSAASSSRTGSRTPASSLRGFSEW